MRSVERPNEERKETFLVLI